MADDRHSRYRSSDPYYQAPGADGQPGSDPLAELAKLIGQNDPFADLHRSSDSTSGSGLFERSPAPYSYDQGSQSQFAYDPSAQGQDTHGQQGYEQDTHGQSYARDTYYDEQPRDAYHGGEQRAANDQGYDERYRDEAPREERYADERYQDDRYSDERYRDERGREGGYRDERYADEPSGGYAQETHHAAERHDQYPVEQPQHHAVAHHQPPADDTHADRRFPALDWPPPPAQPGSLASIGLSSYSPESAAAVQPEAGGHDGYRSAPAQDSYRLGGYDAPQRADRADGVHPSFARDSERYVAPADATFAETQHVQPAFAQSGLLRGAAAAQISRQEAAIPAFESAPPSYLRDTAPPTEEFYDDAPSSRRKGLVTVMAVLCLAVVGTAGAFAYRTVFNRPAGLAAAPPVIRASTEPTKVAPPAPVAEAGSAKLTYDRFGDRSQNEQVVVREEKPVDIRELARSGPPGAVMSGTSMANSAASASVGAAPSSSPNPPSVLTEPKRVRTVPIRPDQPDMAARTQTPPLQMPVTSRQNIAAATPSNAPLEIARPTAQPSPPPVQMRAPAARAAAVAAAPPSGNAPLSLSPNAAAPQAAARDTAPRAAATRTASIPTSGNGRYHVQVASQRSENDAQTAFRNLKGRYSGVLGDRQAVIRRADLGDKGIYYRAMVGPFATREQAVQVCGSLKAAGGDCVVQSN